MHKYNYKRIFRFLIVGGTNALLHFTVLNVCFFILGQAKITSSIIATIVALTYSFFLNKNYVFRNKESAKLKKQAIRFISVTVFGMLIIHNSVFALAIWYLEGVGVNISTSLHSILQDKITIDFIIINTATIIGAIFAMFWNYNVYRFFVFDQGTGTDSGL